MTMQRMKIGWMNLLEIGTVTVTSQASGYPSYRLYDRDIGLPWVSSSSANQDIKVDQAALAKSINALIFAAGHNLAGATITWQKNTVDVDGSYQNVVAPFVVPAGTALVLLTTETAYTDRWTRIRLTGLSAAAQVSELFLTNLYTFEGPSFGSGIATQFNAKRTAAPGGVPFYVKNGPSYKVLTYEIPQIKQTDRDFYQQWWDGWDGCKPFFVVDHVGNAYFGELLTEEPGFVDKEANITAVSVKIGQVS